MTFAENEFRIMEELGNYDLITEFKDEILALVDKFGKSGQSGGSAPYVAGAVSRAVKDLCLQTPIAPVIGDEFREVADGIEQNMRCSELFRENGKCHYLDAIVWKSPQGGTWSGSAYLPDGECVMSRQYVKFPFTPKTFYINVDEEEVAPDDWKFTIINPDDLLQVWEYYDKCE